MQLMTPPLSSTWDSMMQRAPWGTVKSMQCWNISPTSRIFFEVFQLDFKFQILYEITKDIWLLVSKRISDLDYPKVVKKFIENWKYIMKKFVCFGRKPYLFEASKHGHFYFIHSEMIRNTSKRSPELI